MSDLKTRVSIFIKSQFPSYIQEEGYNLVKFIETYFEFLEQYNQPIYQNRKLLEYRNSTITEQKFLEFLKYEFLNNFPKKIMVDERLIISRITDFYRTKGTEDSYKLLFKILYGNDTDLSFYYPGLDILRASDGKWNRNEYITIKLSVPFNQVKSVILIYGEKSGAKAEISKIETAIVNYNEIYKFFSDNFQLKFIQNENIYDASTNTLIGTCSSQNVQRDLGEYLNNDGFLSSNKYLQDNYYYQEYSYVLKSNKSTSEYKDHIQNLIHPTGTLMFGQVDSIDEKNINVNYVLRTDVFDANYNYLNSLNTTLPLNIQYEPNNIMELSYDSRIMNVNVEYDVDIRYIDENGITGSALIYMNSNSTILRYQNDLIRDYQDIPVNLLGSNRLLLGANGANFLLEVENGANLVINDVGNSSNNHVTVENVYRIAMFSIVDPYPYDEINGEVFRILL